MQDNVGDLKVYYVEILGKVFNTSLLKYKPLKINIR